MDSEMTVTQLVQELHAYLGPNKPIGACLLRVEETKTGILLVLSEDSPLRGFLAHLEMKSCSRSAGASN